MKCNAVLGCWLSLWLCCQVYGANAQAQGKKLALLVGVSSYDSYADLPAAGPDAERVKDALKKLNFVSSLFAFDPGTNSFTRAELVKQLKELAERCKEEDLFLFYFAGHGSRRENKDYLLLSNTREDDPSTKEVNEFKQTAFALEEGEESLAAILKRCKAKRRVIIIDACRTSNGRAGAPPGFPHGFDKDFISRVDRVIRAAPPGAAVEGAVLYACSPGEMSKEDPKTNAGLFTLPLAEALKGAAHTANGEVTIGKVLEYVKQRIPVEAHQTPALSPLNAAGLSLGMVEVEPPPSPGIIVAKPFRFRLLECRAVGTQVTCELEVENLEPDDHTLFVSTVQIDGIANVSLRALGITHIVDGAGSEHQAGSVEFANRNGNSVGQSYFDVIAGTKPRLRFTFQDVGVSTTSIARLRLAVGEADKRGVRALPVEFKNIPLLGREAAKAGPPPPDAAAVPGRTIESAGWRLTLQECRRVPEGVRGVLIATNLTDTKNGLFFFWDGQGGITSLALKQYGLTHAIDVEGRTFGVTGLRYRFSFQKTMTDRHDNGQSGFSVGPYSNLRLEFQIQGVPANVKQLARLDAAVAQQSPNGHLTHIPVQFKNIAILGAEKENQ